MLALVWARSFWVPSRSGRPSGLNGFRVAAVRHWHGGIPWQSRRFLTVELKRKPSPVSPPLPPQEGPVLQDALSPSFSRSLLFPLSFPLSQSPVFSLSLPALSSLIPPLSSSPTLSLPLFLSSPLCLLNSLIPSVSLCLCVSLSLSTTLPVQMQK